VQTETKLALGDNTLTDALALARVNKLKHVALISFGTIYSADAQ
jgi:hypothetical protein